MSYNNYVSKEGFGGKMRAITNGKTLQLIPSGATLALTDVPLASEGKIPAGTPIQVDDLNGTAKIFKCAKVATAASASTDIDVEKMFDEVWGSNPLKVGDIVMKMGTTFSSKSQSATITAIDTSDAAKDVITVDTALTLAKGDFLIIAASAAAQATPAVVPNAILPFDVVKHPDAVAIHCEVCFGVLDGVVFNRRIPSMPEQVKVSLRENDCNFRWSESK